MEKSEFFNILIFDTKKGNLQFSYTIYNPHSKDFIII